MKIKFKVHYIKKHLMPIKKKRKENKTELNGERRREEKP